MSIASQINQNNGGGFKRTKCSSVADAHAILCWIVLSWYCYAGVQGRTWTAIVDPSIYDSTNMDIARVRNATELGLFVLETGTPSFIPNTLSPHISITSWPTPVTTPIAIGEEQSSNSPTELFKTIPPRTEFPQEHLPTKQPLGSSDAPSQLPSLDSASSNLPSMQISGAPIYLKPSHQPGSNISLAPTNSYESINGTAGCTHGESLYQVVFYDNNVGHIQKNTTLIISGTPSSTIILSHIEPRGSSNTAAIFDQRHLLAKKRPSIIRRPSVVNVFWHRSPSSVGSSSANDKMKNMSLIDSRNVTVGGGKKHKDGKNFTFQSSNQTESNDFQYVCLEPNVCYHVSVQGGSEGTLLWAVRPVPMDTSATALESLTPIATGNGKEGYTCKFDVPNSKGQRSDSCPLSCNETLSNGTATIDRSRSPTTVSSQPSTSFQPSQTLFPTYTATQFTGHPTGSPSQLDTQKDPTQSPSQKRQHLTHHPTDFSDVGSPVEVKTPFPTSPGD